MDKVHTAESDANLEQRVVAHARALGAQFEVLPCDPALADTAAFCAHYGFQMEDSANAIVVASKSEPRKYAVCLLLATTRLDVNKAVCQKLECKRASFADGEDTARLTGMILGGVTVFGLPETLPIFVDAQVLSRPRVIVGGGSRATKLHVDPEVFRRMPGVSIVENLALRR